MVCNTNKSTCDATDVFAGVASPNCGQFMNPENFMGEQIIYDNAFKDLINNYGIPVDYYINTYNLSAADNFYGEHPTSIFYGPVSLMMYMELTENAVMLSRYGLNSDDELTGYVHIQTFADTMAGKEFYIRTAAGDILTAEEYTTYVQTQSAENILSSMYGDIVTENSETGGFDIVGADYAAYNRYINNGQAIEPKSGDLIQMSPLGCDRPNGRGAKVFEITERTDQDIATINPLMGHYVYRLKARRYEYSFEPGAPLEPQNQQVFENSFSGIISSTIDGVVPSAVKSYPGDVDTDSKANILNMDVNNTDVYGSYY